MNEDRAANIFAAYEDMEIVMELCHGQWRWDSYKILSRYCKSAYQQA